MAKRGDADQICRRFAALREHFGDWEIAGYENLIPAMTCELKDRHVLAAAVRGSVDQIVSANVKDFPPASLAPYGIDVMRPDDFLVNALHMYPSETVAILHEQASALRRPTMTVEALLAGLARCGASQFAREAAYIIASLAVTVE